MKWAGVGTVVAAGAEVVVRRTTEVVVMTFVDVVAEGVTMMVSHVLMLERKMLVVVVYMYQVGTAAVLIDPKQVVQRIAE
jgi:hypothetical protein